ncbi:MAG: eL32 family ribosomal protein [Candidatus Anstonellaceae archaeon]
MSKIKLKKKKKPKFLRPNYGRSSRKRIKDNWRRPRGIDNKKRVKKAYMGASPSIGYSQDKKIRGLHPSGKKEFLVSNLEELKKVPQDGVVRLASTIGRKLRIKLVEQAAKLGLVILNPKKESLSTKAIAEEKKILKEEENKNQKNLEKEEK